ncbi:MAG: hypothetical protein ABIX46_11275 [Burkholderiaceae bacterium]
MRAAPALAHTLTHFGLWHATLIGLALADVGCLWAWTVLRPEPMSAAGLTGSIVLALACLGCAASARGRSVSLAWDGRAWHLGPPGAAPDERRTGRVRVRLDLGVWMLLQFRPDAGMRSSASVWLPVQRGAAAAPWHALRCAVFSPLAPGVADPPHDGG